MEGANYSVEFNEKKKRVSIKGSMRLPVHEYINYFIPAFMDFSKKIESDVEIDLTALEYLNSSGISFISMYLAEMKDRSQQVTLIGSSDISWQNMTMENFFLCSDTVKIVMQ